jgi:hypothetical protein
MPVWHTGTEFSLNAGYLASVSPNRWECNPFAFDARFKENQRGKAIECLTAD